MTTKAAEKIIEGLVQLMEGYQELQAAVESEYSDIDNDDDDEERSGEIDVAITNELRGTLESVIDSEDYSTEEIATAISSLTSALEDLDPDVFASDDDEDDDEDQDNDDDEYYDDDDDIDFDEDELEEDDDDEEDDD